MVANLEKILELRFAGHFGALPICRFEATARLLTAKPTATSQRGRSNPDAGNGMGDRGRYRVKNVRSSVRSGIDYAGQ